MTHISDDCLILDATCVQYQHKFDRFLTVCADIGVPMAADKHFPVYNHHVTRIQIGFRENGGSSSHGQTRKM